MLEPRISVLRSTLIDANLGADYEELVDAALALLNRVYTTLSEDSDPDLPADEFSSQLDRLRDIDGVSSNPMPYLAWIDSALRKATSSVEKAKGWSRTTPKDYRDLIQEMRYLREQVTLMMDRLTYQGRAEASLAAIEESGVVGEF